MLAFVSDFNLLLLTVAFVGVGSSILHPEASRITSVCSGGKRGLAQSVFQVGGNFGSSVGPLLVALIVAPFSRTCVLWFLVVSAVAFAVMRPIVRWFGVYIAQQKSLAARVDLRRPMPLSKGRTVATVAVLMVLIISKYTFMGVHDELLYVFCDG